MCFPFRDKKGGRAMHVRFLAFAVILSLVMPQLVAAQSNVVSPKELHDAAAAAAQARQKHLDDVREFFSKEPVRAALRSAKLDYQKVDKAVATLSPDELARLAART